MDTSPARPIRRIAHLDMDAFYASVELLRYPQLRGLPVVIGGTRTRPITGRARIQRNSRV
jgi:DNA polymerase-4